MCVEEIGLKDGEYAYIEDSEPLQQRLADGWIGAWNHQKLERPSSEETGEVRSAFDPDRLKHGSGDFSVSPDVGMVGCAKCATPM